QVPPDHIAAVGDAIDGSAAVFRHQQQPWSFDTVCRDDVDFGLHASTLRSCVAYEIDLAYASVFTNDDIAGDRPIHDLHKSGAPTVIQRDGGIVFRLDRTDRNAVRVAGACATILVGLRIARGREVPHSNLSWRRFHFQELSFIRAQ